MKNKVLHLSLLGLAIALLAGVFFLSEEITFRLETPETSNGPAETWFKLYLMDDGTAIIECDNATINLEVWNSDPFTLNVEEEEFIGQLTQTERGQAYHRQAQANCGDQISFSQDFFLEINYWVNTQFTLKEYDFFLNEVIKGVSFNMIVILGMIFLGRLLLK
jgi:hypothetical protein